MTTAMIHLFQEVCSEITANMYLGTVSVLRKRAVTIFKFIEVHYKKIWIYKMKNNLVEYLYVWF